MAKRELSGAKDGVLDLNSPGTYAGFAPLVDVSAQAVNGYVDRGIITKGGTYGEWFIELLNHFRAQAVRHGGDANTELTRAKTDEVLVKTAIQRIAYNEQIGVLVDTRTAETVLMDWATYAMREVENEIHTLATKLEKELGKEIPNERTSESIGTIRERIINHAEQLSNRLIDDSEESET